MKVLAFDTATEGCSAALFIDGSVHERFELGPRHAERLLILVDEVLAEGGIPLNDVDALAFGRGPGSFTGLRISAGVAQGLGFGADLPVVPVSSLAAIAQSVDAANILAAIDARMQQVYWAEYVKDASGLVELCGEERVIAPGAVPLPAGAGWVGAGSGWDQYADALQARLGGGVPWRARVYPRARFIAELGVAGFKAGKGVSAERALPVYIRDDVAVKKPPSR